VQYWAAALQAVVILRATAQHCQLQQALISSAWHATHITRKQSYLLGELVAAALLQGEDPNAKKKKGLFSLASLEWRAVHETLQVQSALAFIGNPCQASGGCISCTGPACVARVASANILPSRGFVSSRCKIRFYCKHLHSKHAWVRLCCDARDCPCTACLLR
jgi:hypothetical protein